MNITKNEFLFNVTITCVLLAYPSHPIIEVWPHVVSYTMSVTLVANSYLDENSTKIRNKNVPWDVGDL